MGILFKQVEGKVRQEVLYLIETHEFSWRDSDPDGYVERSKEKREKAVDLFIHNLEKEDLTDAGFLAFDGEKVVGGHLLEIWKIDGKKACHIHGLWVDENYRGRGIASKLKELGENWARERNCQLMDANVKTTNAGMIALNKKLGYHIARFNFRKEL